MKKSISIVIIVAMIILIFVVGTNTNIIANASSNTILSPTANHERIISTTGKASVQTIPDIAYVNIGVTSENQSLKKAQNEVKTKTSNILKELKSFGIKEENIQTKYFNVNPTYNWDEKTNTNSIIGYTVTNSIEIMIENIDKTGDILSKVLDVGSNTVNGLRFGVSNEKKLYNEALSLAVKDAEAKALAMGKSYNIKNLKPVNITENSSYSTPYYKNTSLNKRDTDGAENLPINQGKAEISADVIVEFNFNY